MTHRGRRYVRRAARRGCLGCLWIVSCALSCEVCRAEPATTLLVYDVGPADCRAPVRVKKLIGDACQGRPYNNAGKVSVTPASAWAFTLRPVLEASNA